MPVHRPHQGIENEHLDKGWKDRFEIFAAELLQDVNNKIDAVEFLFGARMNSFELLTIQCCFAFKAILNNQASVPQTVKSSEENSRCERQNSVGQEQSAVGYI